LAEVFSLLLLLLLLHSHFECYAGVNCQSQVAAKETGNGSVYYPYYIYAGYTPLRDIPGEYEK